MLETVETGGLAMMLGPAVAACLGPAERVTAGGAAVPEVPAPGDGLKGAVMGLKVAAAGFSVAVAGVAGGATGAACVADVAGAAGAGDWAAYGDAPKVLGSPEVWKGGCVAC